MAKKRHFAGKYENESGRVRGLGVQQAAANQSNATCTYSNQKKRGRYVPSSFGFGFEKWSFVAPISGVWIGNLKVGYYGVV